MITSFTISEYDLVIVQRYINDDATLSVNEVEQAINILRDFYAVFWWCVINKPIMKQLFLNERLLHNDVIMHEFRLLFPFVENRTMIKGNNELR
jgi:hypothetical protein